MCVHKWFTVLHFPPIFVLLQPFSKIDLINSLIPQNSTQDNPEPKVFFFCKCIKNNYKIRNYIWKSLTRSGSGCATTAPVQPDGAGEVVWRKKKAKLPKATSAELVIKYSKSPAAVNCCQRCTNKVVSIVHDNSCTCDFLVFSLFLINMQTVKK